MRPEGDGQGPGHTEEGKEGWSKHEVSVRVNYMRTSQCAVMRKAKVINDGETESDEAPRGTMGLAIRSGPRHTPGEGNGGR